MGAKIAGRRENKSQKRWNQGFKGLSLAYFRIVRPISEEFRNR
jgi:hypothetical protein